MRHPEVDQHQATITFIGCPGRRSDSAAAEHIGFKAANLARMADLGLLVPPAFVLPIAPDAAPGAEVPRSAIADAMHVLETATGLDFGDERRPLSVSVRSGAAVSMPGMMETILNVGLNARTVRGVIRRSGNPRLAWDSFRRLVQSFGEVVSGCPRDVFDAKLQSALTRHRAANVGGLDYAALRALTGEYLQAYERHAGQPFPQDVHEQLESAIRAVRKSWDSQKAAAYRKLHGIPDAGGTAVTVQQMVYGNGGITSGAGVAFTRNPTDGTSSLYIDFLFNAQGEDVVSGRENAEDAARLARLMPNTYRELARTAEVLEAAFRDMQEFEFTLADGRLFVLQTRSGKRTAWAALQIALDLADSGVITPDESLSRIELISPEAIGRNVLEMRDGIRQVAFGTPANAGICTGRIALDAEAAQRIAVAGSVLLVRDDTSTDDIVGMISASGILTATGGRTSHAAVIARQLELPCVVGCTALRIDLANRSIVLGGSTFHEGDQLSLDGSAGAVYVGKVATKVERPVAALERLAALRRSLAGSASQAACRRPARFTGDSGSQDIDRFCSDS